MEIGKKQKMKLFKQKSLSNRIYSQVAQDIGLSIRKHIISQKKCPSVKKIQSINLLNKTRTQNDPQKSFWMNPYQIQKSKWKFSQPNFAICEKEGIQQYKKYELERFKQKLKSKLQQRQNFKQQQIQVNRSRVKQIRYYQHESREKKFQNFMYQKQSETELFKRTLQKKKMQARILKRQKALELEFKKWHRQQQKLQKHKKKLKQSVRFRTTSY